jgi:hypothetical protein
VHDSDLVLRDRVAFFGERTEQLYRRRILLFRKCRRGFLQAVGLSRGCIDRHGEQEDRGRQSKTSEYAHDVLPHKCFSENVWPSRIWKTGAA